MPWLTLGSFYKIPWITAVNKVLQCLGTTLVWLSRICRRTRCYWHLVGGGQDAAETVYKKRDDSTPTTKNYPSPIQPNNSASLEILKKRQGASPRCLASRTCFQRLDSSLTSLSTGGGGGDHLIFHTHFAFRILSNLTNLQVYGDFCPVQGEWLFIARAPEVLLSHRNLITKESMPFPNSNPDKKLSWTRGPNTL